MSGVKILKCKCNHSFQDENYGKGNRVFNVNEKETEASCTVCNSRITIKTEKK